MTDDASASCTYLMHTGPSGCVDVVPIVYTNYASYFVTGTLQMIR